MNTNEVTNKHKKVNLQNAFGPIPKRLEKVILDTMNSLNTKGITKQQYAERKNPNYNELNIPRK